MAEEPKGNPMQLLLMVLGFMAVLVFLWFASGGPQRADLKGIFLAPPAPLGSDGAYGPQVGQPNPNYTNTNQQ